MKVKVNKVTIQVIQDDILSLGLSGFVNSTDPNLHLNPTLLIKAGLSVQEACNNIGWCDIGDAVLTGAGNLPYEKLSMSLGRVGVKVVSAGN